MNLSRPDLYRMVVEEYVAEEGLQLEALSQDKYEEFLAWIQKKGPKPEWLDDYGKSKKAIPDAPEVPVADIHGAETQAFPPADDIPSDDEPERAYQGFQNDSGPEIESQLTALIQGMEPEEVAELFQSVFEKLPGVELSQPGAEDYPDEETLYSPGAEGRPVAGFQLEELMQLIQEVMAENEWYDVEGTHRPPPHNTGDVESLELIQRIENAYHELQEAFEELPDDIAREMGEQIISDLETLMDTTEYPEDYRE